MIISYCGAGKIQRKGRKGCAKDAIKISAREARQCFPGDLCETLATFALNLFLRKIHD
jgi:hypothetical protein